MSMPYPDRDGDAGGVDLLTDRRRKPGRPLAAAEAVRTPDQRLRVFVFAK